MSASYPSAVKSFAARSAGQTIDPSHINDLQDEVSAIEAALVNGPITLGASTLGSLAVTGASTFTGVATFAAKPLINAGLQFPASQAASADANTLDDYEEGSWTPVLGGTGGTSGQTYGAAVGRYVKIGKLVTANAYMILTAKGTITGNVEVQGLPFAHENVSNLYASATIGQMNTLANTFVSVNGYVAPGASAISLVGRTVAATTVAALTTSDIANTTDLMISVTYRAAA